MQTVHVLGHTVGPWHRAVPLGILAMTVVALSAAFVAEQVYGLEPCVLCLYQRIPYAVAGLVAAAALVVSPPAKPWMLVGCAAVFVMGAGLAFYHVGVQQQWWEGIAACGGGGATPESIEDLRAELREPTPFRPCDEVDWSLFGLSLAAYNGIASMLLATISAWGARTVWREHAG